MMIIPRRKLSLTRINLRTLTSAQLSTAEGGGPPVKRKTLLTVGAGCNSGYCYHEDNQP